MAALTSICCACASCKLTEIHPAIYLRYPLRSFTKFDEEPRLGRPLTATLHADQVRKLRRAGTSKSEIARRLNIGRTSVRRILSSSTS